MEIDIINTLKRITEGQHILISWETEILTCLTSALGTLVLYESCFHGDLIKILLTGKKEIA